MSAGAAFAGMQIAGALLGGIADNRALRAQARVDDENARLTLLAGEEQIASTMREERQISGASIAALAGSGGALGTGTALDIIRQNGIEREVEVANIRAQAAGEARNLRQSAVDARAAGRGALIRGVMSAAGAGISYAADRETQTRLDAQQERERASRLPRPAGIGYLRSQESIMTRPDAFGPRRRRFGVVGMPGL